MESSESMYPPFYQMGFNESSYYQQYHYYDDDYDHIEVKWLGFACFVARFFTNSTRSGNEKSKSGHSSSRSSKPRPSQRPKANSPMK